MSELLSGAIVMACATAGVHFLRFWKCNRDPFFLYFALAFWTQGAQWLHSGLTESSDYSPLYYLARLAAYGLIVFAIIHKNYLSRRREP